MRIKGFLVLLLLIFCDYNAHAQRLGELTQSRILILLDESSSMVQTWPNGKPKYKASHELIIKLMDSMYAVNNQIEFSLRVLGHQHPVVENNCYDTKNEVAFSRDNRTQMAYRLDDIHPLGVTPIAYSLEQAAEHDLVDPEHNAYSIILITDGGESCGGDICEVMKKLFKNKIYFKPYIISLEDDPALKTTYSCMGDYLQVTKDADIPKAVNTIVEAFRPIIKITPSEYKQMQAIAASAPSILKVNIPMVKVVTPLDTMNGVKTFKDTATPRPEPVPEHKIKVEPVRTKPAAEQISRITPAPLNLRSIDKPRPATLKTREITITLPPVVAEVPPPPPPVVIPAPVKISRLALANPKKFNTYSEYGSPRRHMDMVMIPKLPPVVVEAPPPPPVVIPAPEKISRAAPIHPKKLITDIPVAKTFKTVKTPVLPALVFEKPIPAPAPPPPPVVKITIPAPEKISRTTPVHPKKLNIDIPVAANFKTVKTPPLPAVVFEKPTPAPPPAPAPPPVVVVPKHEAEKISKLKPASLARVNVVYVIEEHTYRPRRVPPLPPVKNIPKLAAGATQPANTGGTLGKNMKYDIVTEDAKETSLEIYIVNMRGQLVATDPVVALIDPKTQKVVKQFYRTVGPDGSPDPQKDIPVGVYNLTFPAKKNLVIPNVHVEANKRNKITVKVPNVSLKFAYLGAPGRPVKEFGARVIERDKTKGRVEDQLCTVELEYEPGNYHVRINTFPEDVRNVDLDLDEEYIMEILQPGFAKFTADFKTAVVLWRTDGDKFVQFHTLDLNDPRSQHLQIQPGKYQAHYHKGPGGQSASEKVVVFVIKSNETTEIILP